jgi:hypothetical protein
LADRNPIDCRDARTPGGWRPGRRLSRGRAGARVDARGRHARLPGARGAAGMQLGGEAGRNPIEQEMTGTPARQGGRRPGWATALAVERYRARVDARGPWVRWPRATGAAEIPLGGADSSYGFSLALN